MSEFISVFVTAASRGEAEKIACALIDEKLAACATIMPEARSIYRWQGKIEQADECLLIAKTAADRFDVLAARVRELHSYECPCIVAWPIVAGDADYLKWIRDNVG